MKLRKAIEYAYPTSENAKLLDAADTGCWHVVTYLQREDGSWAVSEPVGGVGFTDMKDPDLVALYHEVDGAPCPYFLRYSRAAPHLHHGAQGR